MSTFDSINPYTLEKNWTFTRHTNDELDTIIQTAHEAYLDWKKTSFSHRQQLFLKLADIMDEHRNEICRLTTIEMWMLQNMSQSILASSANLTRRFANNGERILSDEDFFYDNIDGKYKYDPLWVIYWIAPRNFPYNQVLRAALANIMAGNTTIYKHASNVPLCAAKIEELFDLAWFPKGIYTNIYISWSQSEQIISNPLVQWVNITAGEAAGSIVWWLAGKYLKPSVLELWGNDPFVLLDHKDTKTFAAHAIACRITKWGMWGQRCNSSKRFIVMEKHYDKFIEYMKLHLESLKWWDPFDDKTDFPPIATSKLLKEIHDQVTRSIADGARLVTGGEILWDHGQFYAPTLLADVTPEMTSFREEVFGPVASVIKSKSIEESIALANNSEFGLSATVRWDDIDQLKEVADQLIWGMIFINNPAGSKASLPFGGVRKSGYGKENGPEWLRAFTNKKAVVYSIG